MLQRRGRVSYRTLKRQFELDDAVLEDVKFELIEVKKMAEEKEPGILSWVREEDEGAAQASTGSDSQVINP